MAFVCKMTASQQLAYDATVCALRHHFGDRRARWRDWELHDVSRKVRREVPPNNPVVDVKDFSLIGEVEVPSLMTSFYVTLACAVRVMRDGSRYVFAVHATFPLVDLSSEKPDSSPFRHLSYYLGHRRPSGRSKSDMPKCLRRKFALPPRREASTEQ